MSAEHEEKFQSRKNFHLPSRENVFIHEEVVMTSWHANLNHITFTLPTLLENKTSRLVDRIQNTDIQNTNIRTNQIIKLAYCQLKTLEVSNVQYQT